MSLIAFASAKASPGITTTLVALSHVWPASRPVLLAELDPAGGDLAPRLALGAEPGLVSLAAAARHGLDPGALDAHVQPLAPDRAVLVGPGSAEQARAALAVLAGRLPSLLGALHADVFADCGRLDPASPALEIAAGADVVVLVARPRLDEARHLGATLDTLRAVGAEVALVIVGERPYPPAEVAEVLGAELLGVLAQDPRAARVLAGDGAPVHLARSRLVRSARTLAEALTARLAPPAHTSAPEDRHVDAVVAQAAAEVAG